MRDWAFHHKLQPEQLQFADRQAAVKSVGFYHGGDPLYRMEEFSGTWHEACLRLIG